MHSSTIENMLQWDQQRKLKVEQKRFEQASYQAAAFVGRPEITKLAQQHSRQNSANEYDTVEKRLIDYGEKMKEKQKAMQEKQFHDARNAAAPKIAPHSSALYREGDIVDRLYNLAAKQKLDRNSFEELQNSLLHDNITGQRLFEPQISKTSAIIAAKSRNPHVPIETTLHNRGIEYQMKARWKEQQNDIQAQLLREIPKINSVSEKIVRDREVLQGETTADRLMRPIGELKKSTKEAIEKENPSFKPQINKKSIDILQLSHGTYYNQSPPSSNAQHGAAERYSANQEYSDPVSSNQEYYGEEFPSRYGDDDAGESDSDDRVSDSYYNEHHQQSFEDDQVITLAPDSFRINRRDIVSSTRAANQSKSRKPKSKSSSNSASNESFERIYKRSLRWAEDKAKRIEIERKQKEKSLEDECSFRPNLAKSRSFVAASAHDGTPNAASAALQHGGVSIADRHAEWAKKREQRLDIERKKREEEELQGCSFAPKISTKTNAGSLSPPTSATDGALAKSAGSKVRVRPSSSSGGARGDIQPSNSYSNGRQNFSSNSDFSYNDRQSQYSAMQSDHPILYSYRDGIPLGDFQGSSTPYSSAGSSSYIDPYQTPLSHDLHQRYTNDSMVDGYSPLVSSQYSPSPHNTATGTRMVDSHASQDPYRHHTMQAPANSLSYHRTADKVSPPIRASSRMRDYDEVDREALLRNGWGEDDFTDNMVTSNGHLHNFNTHVSQKSSSNSNSMTFYENSNNPNLSNNYSNSNGSYDGRIMPPQLHRLPEQNHVDHAPAFQSNTNATQSRYHNSESNGRVIPRGSSPSRYRPLPQQSQSNCVASTAERPSDLSVVARQQQRPHVHYPPPPASSTAVVAAMYGRGPLDPEDEEAAFARDYQRFQYHNGQSPSNTSEAQVMKPAMKLNSPTPISPHPLSPIATSAGGRPRGSFSPPPARLGQQSMHGHTHHLPSHSQQGYGMINSFPSAPQYQHQSFRGGFAQPRGGIGMVDLSEPVEYDLLSLALNDGISNLGRGSPPPPPPPPTFY